MEKTVIEKLAETYQQLYLDPDKAEQEEFKRIVTEGAQAKERSLSHFCQDPPGREETFETVAGKVQVITLPNRKDFEVFIRCMMASKNGPRAEVPLTQGAATLIAFNWPRIHAHKAEFMESQKEAGVQQPDWEAEFKRFISVKDNYQDMLIVLSWGPYSNVSAAAAGAPEAAWLETSHAIRKYHELTHFICRRKYPDKISAVWDELVADAIGIYAATGHFDPEMEKRFLGIVNNQYVGGRLGNYTEDPVALAAWADRILDQFDRILSENASPDPFDLIPVLQSYQDEFMKSL